VFSSGLKKHGSALFSLCKRLVFAFNKDSAELLSALLDFLRQILQAESMVRSNLSMYPSHHLLTMRNKRVWDGSPGSAACYWRLQSLGIQR